MHGYGKYSIHTQWNIVQPQRKINSVICRKMNETGGHHVKQQTKNWKDNYHTFSLICGNLKSRVVISRNVEGFEEGVGNGRNVDGYDQCILYGYMKTSQQIS
jgi:hypothetical protein